MATNVCNTFPILLLLESVLLPQTYNYYILILGSLTLNFLFPYLFLILFYSNFCLSPAVRLHARLHFLPSLCALAKLPV